MAKHLFSRRIGAFTLALGTLALAGCAAFAPATPEQIVQQRATAYWKARVAGQVDKAYALSTPSYRQLRTETQFKMQFGAGASVDNAEVTKVNCEAEKCMTQIKISVKPALMGVKVGTIATHLNEIWVLEDGQWWHYQEL